MGMKNLQVAERSGKIIEITNSDLGGNRVFVGNLSSDTSSPSPNCLPRFPFLFGITSLVAGSTVVDLSTLLYLLRLLVALERLGDDVVLLMPSC